MRFKLSIKIGEVFKPALLGNAQNGVLCSAKCLGGCVETILPQKDDKGLSGHLAEPPHKVIGAALAQRGGIRHADRLAVMG